MDMVNTQFTHKIVTKSIQAYTAAFLHFCISALTFGLCIPVQSSVSNFGILQTKLAALEAQSGLSSHW